MASLGLFLQCVTSVIFSLVMERMVLCIGIRKLYLSSVVLLAVSTVIMTVSHNITLVTIMAAATGYTFCILQILPYTLICLYHSNAQVRDPSKALCKNAKSFNPNEMDFSISRCFSPTTGGSDQLRYSRNNPTGAQVEPLIRYPSRAISKVHNQLIYLSLWTLVLHNPQPSEVWVQTSPCWTVLTCCLRWCRPSSWAPSCSSSV